MKTIMEKYVFGGTPYSRLPLLAALVLFAAPALSAGIIFSFEAPGVQQTSVAGATTETFNSLSVGALGSYVSPVGTYSSGAEIVAPDQFGGANQTQYISVGAQSGTTEYTLTLGGLRTYLGFYWQAGDSQNRVDFYSGAVLQGSFTVGDIVPAVSASYFANPNTGQDSAEPFVYLNFTSADLSSRFDRVVFHNATTGTGFETDNHSIFDQIITPPGTPTLFSVDNPEPASSVLMGAGMAGLFWMLRRRRVKA